MKKAVQTNEGGKRSRKKQREKAIANSINNKLGGINQ